MAINPRLRTLGVKLIERAGLRDKDSLVGNDLCCRAAWLPRRMRRRSWVRLHL